MALIGLFTVGVARADQPVILVVGDSLSAAYGIEVKLGWVHLLQSRLKAEGYPHRVVNASISGETTLGGRRRLPLLLTNHRPDIVIIELGANDGLRGMPLTEIARNLHAMAEAVTATGAKSLFIPMRMPPNMGPEYTAGFATLYAEVAAQFAQAAVTPFFLHDVALDPNLLQADGLHPTAQAQPRMLDAVWSTIENALTDQAESAL